MHRLRQPSSAALVALAIVGVVSLAACSPDTADFKGKAEELIEDDEQTAQNFGGLTFDDATCAEPANKDVNTTYTCTATASDGTTASFVATITDDNTISVGYDPSGAAATTVPAAPPTSG
ncbi:MAG: hypothetical protein ACR2HQ_10210 [Ilumatobacteraceae bacterium]